MGNMRDHAGRPIVVVTGMGIVTSLGAGKTDNWAKLTAGESGIRTHHALSDRRLEDDDGRRDRFSADGAEFGHRAFGSLCRRRDRGGRRSVRHRLAREFSRARSFSRSRRSRWTGRSATNSPSPLRQGRSGRLRRDAEALRRRQVQGRASPLPVRLRRRPTRRQVRHQGLADLDLDRLRLRRQRHPARRRGDPPRRDRRRALRRDRLLGQCRGAGALLAAVGAVDAKRGARNRPQNRSRRTATVSCWPKAPAHWCWKASKPPPRAARAFSA